MKYCIGHNYHTETRLYPMPKWASRKKKRIFCLLSFVCFSRSTRTRDIVYIYLFLFSSITQNLSQSVLRCTATYYTRALCVENGRKPKFARTHQHQLQHTHAHARIHGYAYWYSRHELLISMCIDSTVCACYIRTLLFSRSTAVGIDGRFRGSRESNTTHANMKRKKNNSLMMLCSK